ncbi:50S ribosomal protein L11 [Candidatus Nanohalococcus occultus]|uniref:50S ribosomal protein L11 n=1 Tax=Candidatus Nanohalococcus occultus TaxID=2978047 RepID=UPI0039E018E3
MGDKKTISTLIEGGSASAGPPLGPELGPLPTNVGDVVNKINEETASFEGMEVPVDVIVDEETGEFEIEVGKPPAAQLLIDELGIPKGSGEPNLNKVADMSFEQLCKVARMKASDLQAMDLRGACKEILGTAQSMGVTLEGVEAYEAQQEIADGKYDQQLEDEEGI